MSFGLYLVQNVFFYNEIFPRIAIRTHQELFNRNIVAPAPFHCHIIITVRPAGQEIDFVIRMFPKFFVK